ncbi:Ephrin-B2 [Trichinella papuae]|uniref:Ephrin-B2 n=1 Tax=Trichinella papuae TaxID=268474 RepID=A0A0V1MRA2_9BILA|nr:Ephrin-B2 [Trichinella papuae]
MASCFYKSTIPITVLSVLLNQLLIIRSAKTPDSLAMTTSRLFVIQIPSLATITLSMSRTAVKVCHQLSVITVGLNHRPDANVGGFFLHQAQLRQSEQLKPRSTLVSDDRPFVSTKPMEPFVVQLHDKVDLICPQYKRETLPNLLEFSIIYMVDKVGYESCSINSTARLVGLCTVPYKKQVVTVVFRRFTPNPGGLEFVPNQRYYLITTSTGKMEGMQNTNLGLCYSKNMRLQFDVKEENYQPVESSKNKLDINRTSTKPFIIWDQPNHRAGENSRFTSEPNFAYNNPVGNDVYWPDSRFTAPKHRANAYRPARLTERLNDQNQQNNNGHSKASVCSGRLQSLHLHLFALSLFLIISLTCLN